MKKYHAMIWIGLVLVIAGVTRLIAPFSTTIGTVQTSCGNPIAYLDGQDSSASFVTTLSVCAKSLRLASIEGSAGGVIGIVLFVVGLTVVQRRRRRRRRSMRSERREARRDRLDDQPRHAQAAPGHDRRVTSTAAAMRDTTNPEVYEQFMRLGRLTRPKTVLSFFAVVFATLVAGSVIAISLFLKHPDLSGYIPWILVFDAIVAIVLIIGVFVTITKDPARLMLSEITNQNAVALQRGRRRDDPPVNEPVSVRRVEHDGDVAPYRRRWDDPKD